MNKTPVIIDCDPGVDDVLAIVLAITKPQLEVLGITTVAGNVDGLQTGRNARLLMKLLNQSIPVAQGALKPLVKSHSPANVHGKDGLGGLSSQLGDDDYKYASSLNAVEFMKNILEEATEPITIIAVGPLTNIGLLLASCSHLKSKIKCISIMGGGLQLGNKTATAEFNIYVDPEAAHIVLNSGLKLIVAPLNATFQASLYSEDLELFSFIKSEVATFLEQIMWRYAKLDAALHDPVSVLAVSDPDMFEMEAMSLNVETNEGATRGMTYIDSKAEPKETYVITKLDRTSVIGEIVNSFAQFNE